MIEMFAYALGVMYTPGPMNLIALNNGLQRQTCSHLGFYLGVGVAMGVLFSAISLLGSAIVNPKWTPFMALAGCSYILYIALKLFKAEVSVEASVQPKGLTFRDGFLMQLLNPKAPVAVLPVATIQFPALGIEGGSALLWSLVLGVLAFGAPTSYSVMGLILGKRLNNPIWFSVFNRLMAGLLVLVATSIGYDAIYLPLFTM
ncbi:LysE family translocator [Vibrio sonorensis]|uniref:LysE family translocator n=1 Tax=Vibrio sonorensis TaxID=1004316 RepID=UPI0008DA53C1|nr:LysE family transporter [Vibrio sonorensis]